MTKAELIRSAAKRIHETQDSVSIVLDALLSTAEEAVMSGDEVALKGIGAVRASVIPAHEGMDWKTGERTTVPERKTICFIASDALKARLNEGARK